MLVNNKVTPQPNEVWSFKMTNGEEVIATVVAVESKIGADVYTIKKPVILVPTREGFQMMPWLITSDIELGTFVIDDSKILTKGRTVKQLSSQYSAQTSGLVPPQAAQAVLDKLASR